MYMLSLWHLILPLLLLIFPLETHARNSPMPKTTSSRHDRPWKTLGKIAPRPPRPPKTPPPPSTTTPPGDTGPHKTVPPVEPKPKGE